MTTRMPVYDVIVVGAGIEGSSTAYQLAKRGKDVLLLEQFPLPHSRGSSHGQTRVTRKAYGAKEYYTVMMDEAFRMTSQLEAEVGETLFARDCGCLFLGPSSDAHIAAARAALRRHNVRHEDLTYAEMTRRYPYVNVPKTFQFMHDQCGGVLWADKILQAYQKRFVAEGGTLRDGEPMIELIPGHVVMVRTNQGEYRGKSVVLALGPWAAKFLPKLGVHIPLRVERMSVLYWKERVPGQFSQFPTFAEVDVAGKYLVYGLPSMAYPGLVKICLHHGPVIDPDQRDNVDNDWVLMLMKDYVARRFPTLESTPSIAETCIYTNTPDTDFVMDRHPEWRNVVIGAGFSGHGFKLAPVVGKVLSELALNLQPSYDLTPFKIDRFNKSKL